VFGPTGCNVLGLLEFLELKWTSAMITSSILATPRFQWADAFWFALEIKGFRRNLLGQGQWGSLRIWTPKLDALRCSTAQNDQLTFVAL